MVPGIKYPVGKIRVTWEGGIRTVPLTKANHGRVLIKVPDLPTGSHPVTVKYVSTSPKAQDITASPVRLRVR
jgi:hypothetical protein